jgi:peptidoglycan/xylan/chitin deacetylase (PgdA/CDA1 family)
VSDRRRTRRVSLLIALAASSIVVHGQEPKQMAITFDDLPFGYARNLTAVEQREAVTRVLATLDKHRIKATMFVIGQAITDANRGLLDLVSQAGHAIGNHSFSHRDLGLVSAEEYVRDIQDGGNAISPWQKGGHYFRYPYLRQGNTAEKRDTVLAWLALRGIVVAPVTIDNNDFHYNRLLVDGKAEGGTTNVRDAYLDHMMKMTAYYEAKGREMVGRPIKHVLLLHMNYLNSLYLDDLLQRFRDDGWSFITVEEALKDDVYRLKYDYAGVQGAGHLDAIKPPPR